MSPTTPRGYGNFPSQADLFYLCTTLSTSDEALNLHVAPPSKSSLVVGVLLLGQAQIQMLDLAPVDILAVLRHENLRRMGAPTHVRDDAVELDIHYVSETGEGTFPLTSGTQVPVTDSIETAPQFDILLIPGSFTANELSIDASAFITAQATNPGLSAVMAVSSGILSVVQTGILVDKRASAPTPLHPVLRIRYPEVSWQESRFSRHENLWSSSAGLCGVDAMAAWMRQYFWDRSEAVEWALDAAGVPSPADE